MTVPESVLWEMRRGGNNCDSEMNAVELAIADLAYQRITNEPTWSELSPRTAYCFTHLNTFYGTQNPQLLNLIHRLDIEKKLVPFYIEMEAIQGECELRCIQCELTYSLYKEPIRLKFSDFKRTMDMLPISPLWAGNNGLGNPFLNPEYPEMIKYLDDQQIPQEIYMTSFLQSEQDMEVFVKYRSFLFVKFSLDGATAETYEKVRPGVKFDKVIRNIKALAKYKRQAGKHWPQIEFHYLLLKQNLHEAEQFIEFIDSLDIECSGIMFSKLLHYFPEIKDIYTEVPEGLGQKLVDKGKSYGIPVFFNSDASTCKPQSKNCSQFLMPYILPDGTVLSCCQQNEQNRRGWQREQSMGNVFEQDFREIWWGKKFVELRKKLRENEYPPLPICDNCSTHIPSNNKVIVSNV